jgi:hypothetical protein
MRGSWNCSRCLKTPSGQCDWHWAAEAMEKVNPAVFVQSGKTWMNTRQLRFIGKILLHPEPK